MDSTLIPGSHLCAAETAEVHDPMQVSPTRPLSRRITDLLKELHIIDHPSGQQIDEVESSQSTHRRQEIRRELVRIVNLLGWRQAFPLRLWMYGRASKRIQ